MQNRVYYHALKDNTNTIELCHFYYRGIIKVNTGGENYCLLIIKNNGYDAYGDNLPSDISIYFDSTNNIFYVVKTASNNTYNLTIVNDMPVYHGSDLISGKAQIIDVSGYTKLEKLNIMQYPIKKVQINTTANETYSYTTINNTNQYQSYMSLVMINARNQQGTSFAGVYMMHKVNSAGNTQVYTLTEIVKNGTESTWGLTATNTGFSLTNNQNATYKILELACGSTVI